MKTVSVDEQQNARNMSIESFLFMEINISGDFPEQ